MDETAPMSPPPSLAALVRLWKAAAFLSSSPPSPSTCVLPTQGQRHLSSTSSLVLHPLHLSMAGPTWVALACHMTLLAFVSFLFTLIS